MPGAQASLDRESVDRSWRSASIRVTYQGHHLAELAGLRPFVLLEVGSARVTPSVERDLTSFVHDYLAARDQLAAFDDNRPLGLRCVHPLVTLIEKLDALQRRVTNDAVEPAVFVRHFEDCARVIAAASALPPLPGYADAREFARDMLAERQIRRLPASTDPAFASGRDPRWDAIRAAYAAIAPMFWGERIELDDACMIIREWVLRTFGE